MKVTWKSRIYTLCLAVILAGNGCQGSFLYNSISDFLSCLFYGDCEGLEQYGGYFSAIDKNDRPDLTGSWRSEDPASTEFYIVSFKEDRTLRVEKYKKGGNEAIRIDTGSYLQVGNKITISMENGTRSVVHFSITDGILKLSLANKD